MRGWRTTWNGVALILLVGLLIAAGFFGVTRDRLFFHSDPVCLGLTLAFLSALLASGPALLWILFSLWSPTCAVRCVEAGVAVAAWGLLAAFPLAALGYAALGLRWEWALAVIRSPIGFWLCLILIAAGSAYFAFFSANRSGYRRRTSTLASVLAVLLLLGLGVGLPVKHMSGTQGAAETKSLRVMIVLDGLPARYLSHFGWDAPETELDRAIATSDAQRQVRSSAVWTFGWFGTLYSGTPAAVLHPLRRVDDRENLLARLQRGGTSVRWMAFHQNGIPESSAGHVSAYAGLRSSFLTPRYAWIPRFMGLDYHLVLPNPAIESLLIGGIAHAAFEALNPGWRQRRADSGVLQREIAHYAATPGRKLLIFHTHWKEFSRVEKKPPQMAEALAPLWDVERDDGEGLGDYFYAPEQAAGIEARRQGLGPAFDALGAEIRTLRDQLPPVEAGGSIEILLTADHGAAYEQGRLAYGYHPLEAVIQVPLVLYGGDGWLAGCLESDATGQVPPIDTRDLHALLAAQGMDQSPCPAIDGAAATVTLRADRRAEWYLVLARGNEVLRANIHPESDGKVSAFVRDGYHLRPTVLSPERREEARSALAAALPAFSIASNEVHRAFSR